MTYEEIVNLALRRGLFFPASEIYQTGPAGFYDFGPHGASIRRKIIELWRNTFVKAEGFLEIDGAITMPAEVFKASGHLDSFNDPMTQCKKCNTIHRADKLLEAKGSDFKEATPVDELTAALRAHKIVCPKCKGELMDVRQFNMMVKAEIGVGGKTDCYLRPETCQTIFTSWHRLMTTNRIKLPQGISQVGKAYRNEISPRQTLLRQVEFSQMETEVFFDPKAINTIDGWDDVKTYKINIMRVGKKTQAITAEKLASEKTVSGKLIAYYLARTQQYFERLGIPLAAMRFREVDDDERAFYAKEGWDFEVKTSIGWLELIANNYRTDYDLKQHMNVSGKDLHYVKDDGSKIIPHVWEVSIGLDRTIYTVLELAYRKEKDRVWLALPPTIAPLLVGVCPLLKNKPELTSKAKEITKQLRTCYDIMYDETGSIGKRYARFDEIGVPWCVTIDFDSLEQDDVTIRERDTGTQERIPLKTLKDELFKRYTR